MSGVPSPDDVKAVALAVLRGHRGEPVNEDEIERAVGMFVDARLTMAFLELARADRLAMRWNDELGDWQLSNYEAER